MAGEYHSIRVTRATFEKLLDMQRRLVIRAGAFAEDRAWGVTQGDVVAVAIEALRREFGLAPPKGVEVSSTFPDNVRRDLDANPPASVPAGIHQADDED